MNSLHRFDFAAFGMNYRKIARKMLATHSALRKPRGVPSYSPICQITEGLCKSCQDRYLALIVIGLTGSASAILILVPTFAVTVADWLATANSIL